MQFFYIKMWRLAAGRRTEAGDNTEQWHDQRNAALWYAFTKDTK